MKVTIYTDGASRGNPGPASYGYVVLDEHNKLIHEAGQVLGLQTNNFAEYTAVREALSYVIKNLPLAKSISIKADSKLVIEQLAGRFRIKNEALKVIYLEIKKLCANFEQIHYQHVPREQNKQADRMANMALDNTPPREA